MLMKKFIMLSFAILIIAVACSPNVQAQTQPKPEQYLTPEQVEKYNKDLKIAELEKKIQTYGNWVGVGGEIGQAVNEGLSAVVDVSDKFSKTDVGKFTMFMIAWKVMGDSAFGYLFGTLYFIISTIVLVRIFNRLIKPRRILIENPGLFKYPKKYEIIPASIEDDNSVGAASVIFAIIMLVNIGITCGIIF